MAPRAHSSEAGRLRRVPMNWRNPTVMAVLHAARSPGPARRVVRPLVAHALLVLALWAVPGHRATAQRAPDPASAVLRPGDKIRVRIWREPDLSGEFTLPVDGVVDFPSIGRITVGQLTVDSVEALLTARYAKSLREPSIEVTPLRRVRVSGAVRSPGYYYADPTITAAGAVLLAGGVTQDGNEDRVDLLRSGARRHMTKSGGSFQDDVPVQSGDEISVPVRSWLSRNTAIVASVVTGVALVIATVVR